MSPRSRNLTLLLGDAIALYTSLVLALWLRGGADYLADFWNAYFRPFTILHAAWLAIFYINDFYAPRRWRVDTRFFGALVNATAVNAVIAVVFFYLDQSTGITPKTNLAVHLLFSTLLVIGWRGLASWFLRARLLREPVLFVEMDACSADYCDQLEADPTAAWHVAGMVCLTTPSKDTPAVVPLRSGTQWTVDTAALYRLATEKGVRTIVVGNLAYNGLRSELYDLMLTGVAIRDAASFWEDIHGEVPLDCADAAWFFSGFADTRRIAYDSLKRFLDLAVAFILGVGFSWLILLIAILVKLTSRGPALYRQERVGHFDRRFTLYKFRTMTVDAEKDGPQWSQKNDNRVTRLGRFLRHTHLDEFPQLWNILKGEMSFIGPRPERPEFVAKLKETIPFFSLRHLVKPGITGWAQVNYPYGASVADARRKLAFDLYYIKRRSAFLDLQISLKTLAMLFRGEGR